MKKSHAKAVQTVKDLKAETSVLQVPSSKSALDLYRVFQRFLTHEERMIQADFAEIVRIVEDPEMHIFEKVARIGQLSKQIERDEEAVMAPLRNAQQAFAQEHNLKGN